jgi:hypothetical protein
MEHSNPGAEAAAGDSAKRALEDKRGMVNALI